MSFLLTDSWALRCLGIVYVAAGVAFVLSDYTLNDEGVLTYYWASWARQDFVPTFFLQRIRPVVAVLYLPASIGGLHGTMIAHVLVAASSLVMLARVARALGYRLANLPAFVVALSPVYFYGGAAGISNVDGVVGICFVLYLLCALERPLLAGMVAGSLPWIRPELAVFSACLAVYAVLSTQHRRLLLGIATFPLLYAITGALYHHDLLWIIHFPPTAATESSALEWRSQLVGMRYFLEPLLALTPIAAVVVLLRPARLLPVERAILAYLVVGTVLLNGLPILKVGNFGTAPRYSLCLLPALALLIGRAFEPWWEGKATPAATLTAMAAVALWLATRQQDPTTVILILSGYTLLLVAAGMRWSNLVGTMTLLLLAAGPLLQLRQEVGRAQTAASLDPIVKWLVAHRDQVTGPVFTNLHVLAPFLESRVAGLDVRFVAGAEMAEQGLVLTNASNGQRARIQELARTNLYGRTLFESIAPETIPANALLVFQEDERLPPLPDAIWASRLDVLEQTTLYRIARVRPGK